jgi:hypothetical protein
MSSAVIAPSQVPASKRYIVENAGGYMMNMAMNGVVSLGANTILFDMGKTILHTADGMLYRKVMIAPFAGTSATGYICLDSDRINNDNNSQGVRRLN